MEEPIVQMQIGRFLKREFDDFFKFFKRQIIKFFHRKSNRNPNHLKHRNSNETLELKRKLLKFRNCSKMGQLKPLINSLIFMAFLKTGESRTIHLEKHLNPCLTGYSKNHFQAGRMRIVPKSS